MGEYVPDIYSGGSHSLSRQKKQVSVWDLFKRNEPAQVIEQEESRVMVAVIRTVGAGVIKERGDAALKEVDDRRRAMAAPDELLGSLLYADEIEFAKELALIRARYAGKIAF